MVRRPQPKQQRQTQARRSASASPKTEDRSAMGLNSQYDNGAAQDNMPPPDVLFPRSRHDAQIELGILQKILWPFGKGVFWAVAGLIALAIQQGWIVAPWKGDIESAIKVQIPRIEELRDNQRILLKTSEDQGLVLQGILNSMALMNEKFSSVSDKVSEIRGRISPLAPDLSASTSAPIPVVPRSYIAPPRPKTRQGEEWRASAR